MPEAISQLGNLDEIKKEIRDFFRKNFPTPAHLLAWMDDSLNDGTYSLYYWQANTHKEYFSVEAGDRYTALDPLELCIRAVNGSGKDEKVIAPFVLHFLGINLDSSIVLTSASAQQLKTQTEKYIARYVTILNAKLSRLLNLENVYEFYTHVQRNVKCNFTGGEAFLFATDEEGKAEGYHPVRSGAKMAIIVNEGKTIKEEIWEALSRCNGFTHWIEVSSPGKPDGHFFRTCTSKRLNNNGELAVKQVIVRSLDCPHLGGENYINRLVEIYGSRDHYMVKSMVDAEFSSNDEQVVIPYDKYNKLIEYQRSCEYLVDNYNTGGLDLGFGGDEIVLQIRNGNKHLGTEKLISKDTNIICDTIKKWLEKWYLVNSPVYADASGLGEPIVSLLRGPLYNFRKIIPIKNNWSPSNPQAYANLGTEMWFALAKLIEDQAIILLDEEVFRKQICNRYYKLNADNTAQLESKPQAKAKGRPSPDRADAMVLCFHKFKSPQAKAYKDIKQRVFGELANVVKRNIQPISINSIVRTIVGEKEKENYYKNNGIIIATRKSLKQDIAGISLELKQAQKNIVNLINKG